MSLSSLSGLRILSSSRYSNLSRARLAPSSFYSLSQTDLAPPASRSRRTLRSTSLLSPLRPVPTTRQHWPTLRRLSSSPPGLVDRSLTAAAPVADEMEKVDTAARLEALRQLMAENKVDIYGTVPSSGRALIS